MNVKFLDVAAINARFRNELLLSMEQVLDSGAYIKGKSLRVFEEAFAEYCGVKYCVGMGNGLDALTGILEACIQLDYLKKGDEVIVPANTFIATALSVRRAGLKIVFCEPDIATFNLSATTVKNSISNKTRAIIAVHLYGLPAPMEALQMLANEHQLLLIEDAAQAHGALIGGKKAGSFGLASAFSFYPGKNLGAIGDGGAVCTSDPELYKAILRWGNYGSEIKYLHDSDGVNSRLDSLQAAILLIKLKYLDSDNERRNAIATRYLNNIHQKYFELPVVPDSYLHVWHVFAIKCSQRDELQKYLLAKGVETIIHYPVPIFKQAAFPEFSSLNLPECTALQQSILSLPISPVMSDNEVQYVIDVLNSWSPK